MSLAKLSFLPAVLVAAVDSLAVWQARAADDRVRFPANHRDGVHDATGASFRNRYRPNVGKEESWKPRAPAASAGAREMFSMLGEAVATLRRAGARPGRGLPVAPASGLAAYG